MIFYNSFQEFCEKNNLTKAEAIAILENEFLKQQLEWKNSVSGWN